MKQANKPILCLDFDGVIHRYSKGWQNGKIYDVPTEGAGESLLKFVCHFKVSIFSSRSKNLIQRIQMKKYIRALLWDACLTHTNLSEQAWSATQGKPSDYIPWTAYDVLDVADHIHDSISYPWFKPPALVTIDDRAMTFNGNWSEFTPEKIKAFNPWTMEIE